MAEPPSSGKTLADLPADAVAQCSESLDLRDVANLSMTCKSLRAAAYSDYIWFRLFAERWPNLPLTGGVSDIRGKYIDRLAAVRKMIFSDPSSTYLAGYSAQAVHHLILDKSNLWACKGSDVQHWRLDKFGSVAGCKTLSSHGSRISNMRLIPVADTWLSRGDAKDTGNMLVTSSADRTIRLWWKDKSQRCFKGHNGPVTALSDKLIGGLRDTKLLASGGEDCTVRMWSVGSGYKNHAVATYHGHEKPLAFLTVAGHKPSLLISISKDSKLRAWDTRASGSSPCVGTTSLTGMPIGVKCHDTICYVATRSSVVAVDLRTMQRAFTLPVNGTEVCSFETLPAKWMMCTGVHDRALLWDIRKSSQDSTPVAELDSDGKVTLLHMDLYKTLSIHRSIDRSSMARQRRPSDLLLFSLVILLVSPIPALSFSGETPTARRVLVLLDDLALRSSHSIFFTSLTSRGYQLDFKLADDSSLSIHRYGEFLYDGLILFAPSASRFGGSLDQSKILEFVDAGHDLLLAVDSSASDLIRGIATDCGADFDEDPEAVVIDHLSYAVSDTEGDHTLIASDNLIKSNVILGEKTIEAPILFRGVGHSVNPANTLVLKALTASPSAYSANPKTKLSSPPSLIGSAISLVSVMQARNNARVLISGSLELFSNRFLRSSVQKAGSKNVYEKSGNEQFVTEVAKWVFHERGHLKAVNVKHNKVGETTEPAMYRINDDLEYSVEIYEWSGKSWEPYVADDVQVQFFMMSPYVLKTMSHDKKGLYSTSFKVPDVYGVFQFKVEYERLGYTSLSLAKQIPVRPFRHNEYERFIPAAFPYYAASFSTMGAFFIFSIVYLYHK